ncbi:amino acid adenylation domain-containing protein [Chitinophaga polysaccharea]|uniref:non-ribosomal peptide synthetase n=1 Tax=Chitinophaga polysaccharea TaxID=1293035 RepID=UPI0014554F02|nr:non-ribosomal peptide synthetase [Chitinophaga polysaccharea]NLR57678.1 amino acid adenylation domain-containing protein [Chitinophaga polysaccharea]
MKFEASYHQERLWFIDKFEKGNIYDNSPVYHNVPIILHLHGVVDQEAMEMAIRELIQRHDALRTVFEQTDNLPYQQVEEHIAFQLGTCLTDHADEELITYALSLALQPMTFLGEPLIRGWLITSASKQSLLVISIHHSIIDKPSVQLFIQELTVLYEARVNHTKASLPAPLLPYSVFSKWQKNLGASAINALLSYWKRKLNGKLQAVELPLDRSRSLIHTFSAGRQSFRLDPSLEVGIKRASEAAGVTPRVFFLTAFKWLLKNYSGVEEIVLGTPAVNRIQPELKNTIGPISNLLVLRTFVEERLTFADLAARIADTEHEALRFQSMPFDKLVKELAPQIDMGRTALFDILFAYEEEMPVIYEAGPLRVEYIETNLGWGKYDLNLLVQKNGNDYHGILVYNSDYFNGDTISRMIGHYLELLKNVVKEPATELSQLSFLSIAEREKIMSAFNTTGIGYQEDATIIDLFNIQVGKHPAKIAIRDGDTRLTYAELDTKANRVAHALRRQGIGPESVVALALEHHSEMIVAILGTLKVGAAYLPLDHHYPDIRTKFMIEDSGCRMIISTTSYNCAVIDKATALLLDRDIREEDTGRIENTATSASLAYIIYTSGTTGMPKGVMIENRNVVRLFFNDRSLFDFNENDVWSLFHSCCFDFSVWEMYGALLFGGELVIVPKAIARDTPGFLRLLREYQVTVLNQTPTAFYNLSETIPEGDQSLKVRYVIFGGEALAPAKLTKWRKNYPATRLVNMYGITETTVHVTYKEITDQEISTGKSNVGKPIPTTTVYILDSQLQLVPIGVTGEIYVGGKGVGRGYHGNPELTASRFIASPFSPAEKLYRSGDSGRWLENGDIEYYGRIDHQVQLHGFRIEPGEIESRIVAYEGVKDAVVVLWSREEQHSLCAYYVADNAADIPALRAFLSAFLPDYMIPSYFVLLESIPLTINGKVDKAALPAPAITLVKERETPGNELERQLVKIYEEVLGVANISISDNFFFLGGDSIKTIQVSSRLHKEGYELKVQDIFRYPEIKNLSACIRKKGGEVSQHMVPGKAPLSPIQRWFFESDSTDRHYFNQAVVLKFAYYVDEDVIAAVFTKLTAHHDALRMSFKAKGVAIIQETQRDGLPFSLDVLELLSVAEDVREAAITAKVNEVQASIDLENGPLVKLVLCHTNHGSQLFVIIHHLVVDGVSWRILLEDMDALFRQHQENRIMTLPGKTTAFSEWVAQLQEYVTTAQFGKARKYWHKNLSDNVQVLPSDVEGSASLLEDVAGTSFIFPADLTTQLLTVANHPYRTSAQDLLLTAFTMALQATFGISAINIDMEGHGRESIGGNIDVSRTVGWFTTIYPVKLISCAGNVGQQIRMNKESLRRVPNGGIDFGICKYFTDDTHCLQQKDPSVRFNYLGQFDADTSSLSFEVSSEAGITTSHKRKFPYALDVSAIVTGGRLHVRASFSRKQYLQGTIDSLMNACEEALKEVVRHCVTAENHLRTPADFTYSELSVSEADTLQQRYEVQDMYPLSPMQEGMLFHSLLDPASYLVQFSYTLKGNIDVTAMQTAFSQLVQRYDVLRTVFVYEGMERPLQLVLKQLNGICSFTDIREEVRLHKRSEVVNRYRLQERDKHFRLDNDLLIRIHILQAGSGDYEFIWCYHHILMDGWCTNILIREFTRLYEAATSGSNAILPAITPYVNYINWLEEQDAQLSRSYWERYLFSYEGPAGFPKLSTIAQTDGVRHRDEEVMVLGIPLVNQMKALANETGVTLNTLMQTAWGILLSRYNNTNDVVFGAVVSGRSAEIGGVENMIGLFINTIPVRIILEEGGTVASQLRRVQERALESLRYEYYPLVNIQAELFNGRELISHIMAFENFPVLDQVDGLPGITADTSYQVTDVKIFEETNYDLTIVIVPGEEITIKCWFNPVTYSRELVADLLQQFSRIIMQMTEDAQRQLKSICMLEDAAFNLLVDGFNDTARDYNRHITIHELFEQQVLETPHATALVYEDKILTYNELNVRANRLARQMMADSTEGGELVAILMNRSPEMIITLFAILKSGGTYVPIEPHLPDGRIIRLLQSLGCRKLVIDKQQCLRMAGIRKAVASLQQVYCFDLPEENTDCISIEMDCGDYRDDNLNRSVSANDTAYVIFTSGSSGMPKGVVVRHQPVINLIEWVNNTYHIDRNDKVLFVSSLSFDLSVYDIFGLLAAGGSVQIVPNTDIGEPQKLLQQIYRYGITYWDSAPAALQQLTPWLEEEQMQHNALRLVFLSGDWIPLNLPTVIKSVFRKAEVIALGGATEATVWSNSYPVQSVDPQWKSIPYGKPMQNAKYYILDKDLQPCPIGVPGDLFIGGECIADGYLNEVALTAFRFIDNPFRTGEKMYRTGDTARWYADGNIEFLGRKDAQVKIRGHRIELGEIQYQLRQVPGIKEARVFVQQNQAADKFLCAYFISDQPIEAIDLRTRLQEELPGYMVPVHFIQIPSFPVTANGKLDISALPNPVESTGARDITAPRNHIERQLLQSWAHVFKRPEDTISIHDNFFDLGGHSIKAAVLVSYINKKMNTDLPLRAVFSAPTIAELALHCKSRKPGGGITLRKAEKKEYYKTTSTQQQLFLVQKIYPQSTAYNLTYTCDLGNAISPEKLATVVNMLVKRHEALRTSFRLQRSKLIQFVLPELQIEIEYILIQADSDTSFREQLKEQVKRFIRPFSFDMDNTPLIRIGYVDGLRKVALVDMHHIISDQISQQILARELTGLLQGNELPLQQFHYKDIAEARNTKQFRRHFEKMENYWVGKLNGTLPEINLSDKPRPAVKSFDGARVDFVIEEGDTQWLKTYAHSEKTTLNVLVLTLFNVVIATVTRMEEVVMGFNLSGRSSQELENVVGSLLNTLVLHTFPLSDRRFSDYFKTVSNTFMEAVEHQEFTLDDLLQVLNVPRDTSRNPLFEIMYDFYEPETEGNNTTIPHIAGVLENNISKFDLCLQISAGTKLYGSFYYASAVLDEKTIHRYISIFRRCIAAIRENRDVLLKDMNVLATTQNIMSL